MSTYLKVSLFLSFTLPLSSISILNKTKEEKYIKKHIMQAIFSYFHKKLFRWIMSIWTTVILATWRLLLSKGQFTNCSCNIVKLTQVQSTNRFVIDTCTATNCSSSWIITWSFTCICINRNIRSNRTPAAAFWKREKEFFNKK